MPDMPKPKRDNVIFVQSSLTMSIYLHPVSKKTRHPTRVHNLAKYESISKILSLLDSVQNLLQNGHYISHHILKAFLHYPLKRHVSVIGKFCSKHTRHLRSAAATLSVGATIFFSFFSGVSSLRFIRFFIENFANNPREPQPSNKCKFSISALSSSLKGMLFSCFDAIKINFYFFCQIRLLLSRLNKSVSKI